MFNNLVSQEASWFNLLSAILYALACVSDKSAICTGTLVIPSFFAASYLVWPTTIVFVLSTVFYVLSRSHEGASL